MTCRGIHCQLGKEKGNGTRKGRLLRWLFALSGSFQGHSVDSIWGVEGKEVGRSGSWFCSSYYCGICRTCRGETLVPESVSPSWWLWGAWDEIFNFLSYYFFPSSFWCISQLCALMHAHAHTLHTHEHLQAHTLDTYFILLESLLLCWVT